MTTDHRAEAARLLSEAETTFRDGLNVPTRHKQIAFGEEPADRALRVAGLLTAMASAHAQLAPPLPAARTWRASRTGITLGYYTSPFAAQEHCEDDARTVQGITGVLQWAYDEEEPDDRAELDVQTDGRVESTGYAITAVHASSAYDPQEEG